MSKRILIPLLLLMSSPAAFGYHFTGHSFFSVRTPFQTASPEKEALWHYDWLDKADQGICGSFEIVPFGGKAKSRSFDFFFAPQGKTTLDVVEFNPDTSSSDVSVQKNRDLEARHFNIETRDHNFRSRIELHPHHTFVGVGFAWRQRLWDCWWF